MKSVNEQLQRIRKNLGRARQQLTVLRTKYGTTYKPTKTVNQNKKGQNES